jgi:hypothetical protein
VRTTDELIDCIVSSSRIPSAKRRGEIQRELRSHIEDLVGAARAAGRDQDEIEKLVLANFGDPCQIAQGFAWVYRHERRRLQAVAFTLSTVLLASGLSAAILATQAVLALGLGTPVLNVVASRHTLIEALDILASMAAYMGLITLESLFESHPFQKAAFLLMAIVAMLKVVCGAAGLHVTFLVFGLVNGVFLRAVQRFITPKAARAAIVTVCFLLTGFVSALMWSRVSHFYPVASCASWLAMGVGYLLITSIAPRVEARLLNGLQRIQAGC